jgi:hypothetical protein
MNTYGPHHQIKYGPGLHQIYVALKRRIIFYIYKKRKKRRREELYFHFFQTPTNIVYVRGEGAEETRFRKERKEGNFFVSNGKELTLGI